MERAWALICVRHRVFTLSEKRALRVGQCYPKTAQLKNNIKPLKGEYSGKFRLRVRDYRVIFRIEEEKVLIMIIRIGHRKEVY